MLLALALALVLYAQVSLQSTLVLHLLPLELLLHVRVSLDVLLAELVDLVV